MGVTSDYSPSSVFYFSIGKALITQSLYAYKHPNI